jgi:hypothetical protein
VDAIKFSADKVIRQLMGMSVQENSQPFDPGARRYAMPARNKEEALAQIAEEGSATPQTSQQIADPAMQRPRRPMNWREQLAQRQRLAEKPKEVQRDQPQRDDNGEVQWLL